MRVTTNGEGAITEENSRSSLRKVSSELKFWPSQSCSSLMAMGFLLVVAKNTVAEAPRPREVDGWKLFVARRRCWWEKRRSGGNFVDTFVRMDGEVENGIVFSPQWVLKV